MPHFGDDLYLGPLGSGAPGTGLAPIGGPLDANNPAPMPYGVGPLGRVYAFDIVPAAAAANNICAAQAIAGAANAVINGALAQALFTVPGTGTPATVAVIDYDRALQMASSNAGDTTQTVTITGYDRYLQPLSQVKTLNGTNAVNFTKAFKYVTQVAVSGVMAGNLTVGTRDAFGLPFYISNAGYVAHVGWNNTLARDAGTLTVGDATSPATTATTDVRGLYAPSSAADGVKRLVMLLVLTGAQCGPSATRASAAGVTQNLQTF